MSEIKRFYVISMGVFDSNKVYLDNPKFYKAIPTTTKNVLYAKWFENEDEAYLYAKKHFAANVEGFKIVPIDDTEETIQEVTMLRSSNLQLQRELNELKEQLKRKEETNGK